MSQQTLTSQVVLQSKIDGKHFNASSKTINVSELLKNICDLTEISEPIILDIPSRSLHFFIELMNHYETAADSDEHDKEFELNFYYDNFKSDDEIIRLIQDLSILDSDFFMDSVADFILHKIDGMRWDKMREYLGIEENDLNKAERRLMRSNILQYIFAYDFDDALKFPFPEKSLYSLKTKFSSPMNAFLTKLIQRSSAKVSFQLSLINKTLKNEVDRWPLKFTAFSGGPDFSVIQIDSDYGDIELRFVLHVIEQNERYFSVIRKRKVLADEFNLFYCIYIHQKNAVDGSLLYSSLDFAAHFQKPTKAEIKFQGNFDLIYLFDVAKCPLPFIFYDVFSMCQNGTETFDDLYNHLIAKDLSKEIEISLTTRLFKMFNATYLTIYKKPNASKFHKLKFSNLGKLFHPFRNFVLNYLEEDGIVQCYPAIPNIPVTYCTKGLSFYSASLIKQYMNVIIAN